LNQTQIHSREDITVTLPEGYTFRGRIYNENGLPLSNQRISLHYDKRSAENKNMFPFLLHLQKRNVPFSSSTDHNGEVLIENLPEGRYRVSLNGKPYSLSSNTVSIPHDGTWEASINVKNRITGVVVDENGIPIPEAILLPASPDPGSGATRHRCDEKGRFFMPKTSQFPLDFTVIRPGYETASFAITGPVDEVVVYLKQYIPNAHPVPEGFRSPPSLAAAISLNGMPPETEKMKVILQRKEGNNREEHHPFIKHGWIELRKLEAGSYDAEFHFPGFEPVLKNGITIPMDQDDYIDVTFER
jgi:hypothetical protein